MKHWKNIFAASSIAVMSLGLVAPTTVAEEVVAPTAVAKEVVAEPACDVADPYCHNFAKAKEYYLELGNTEESFEALVQHLRAFTDFGLMARVMGDPEESAKLMAVLADPDVVHLMLRGMQEPVMWDTWVKQLTNPQAYIEMSLVAINPMTYIKWMTSPVNVDVYSALKPFVQSELYADWANKGTKIKLYEPTWSFMNPQWTVDRLAWAIDPKTYVNPFTWIMEII
jgi:hypothetical protein